MASHYTFCIDLVFGTGHKAAEGSTEDMGWQEAGRDRGPQCRKKEGTTSLSGGTKQVSQAKLGPLTPTEISYRDILHPAGTVWGQL